MFCKHWIFIRCLKGAITFLIGFTGCVGALRENTALLAAYAIFLAILLLLEMTAGILGFIFKDWVGSLAFMSKGCQLYNYILIRSICHSPKMNGEISVDKAYTFMFKYRLKIKQPVASKPSSYIIEMTLINKIWSTGSKRDG